MPNKSLAKKGKDDHRIACLREWDECEANRTLDTCQNGKSGTSQEEDSWKREGQDQRDRLIAHTHTQQ